MIKNNFRPKISSYLDSLMMLFVMVISMALYLKEIISLLLCIICLLSLLCVIVFGLYKTWRQSLLINEEAIQGHVGELNLKIYWQDIISIKLVKAVNLPTFLLIGTRVDNIAIYLKDLNDKKVWQAVEAHAHPSSLEENTYV